MNVARALDLLADRAVQGLEPGERTELERLLDRLPELDDDSFELAAAAVDLALGPTELEPLPAALAEQLRVQGEAWVAALPRSSAPQPAAAAVATIRTGVRRSPLLPWFVAAAASLLALLGWLRTDAGEETLDVASARATLIATASDLVRHAWSPGAEPLGQGVAGDVVWSDAKQAGFMRFEGLAANDPRVEQYQLWIFDRDQSLATPVDGGVFDIPPGGAEAVVPIDPKLVVGDGFAFAITVEKPGGVVVSSRERLALVAGL